MSKKRARCPCGFDLWDRRQGEMTLKTSMIKPGPLGNVLAMCPKCKQWLPVPFLRLLDESPPQIPVIRLDGSIPP